MPGSTTPRADFSRLLRISGRIIAAVLVVSCALLATHWPFTRDATVYSLERVSSSQVQIGAFHEIFFPHPGYIAESMILTRNSTPGSPPLVRVRRLTCLASWFAVLSFTHRTKQMRLEAMEVYIPTQVPPPVRSHRKAKIETTVTELVADGAILEVAPRRPGGQTLRFDFSQLTVSNVAGDKSMSFCTVLHNPEPPGYIMSSGAFGPLLTRNVGQTPVSGSFAFTHADLSPYRVIAGTVSANSTFKGTLARTEVRGKTDIPNFEVTRSGHALDLAGEYQAIVDAVKGNVALQSADTHFLRTTVYSLGTLASESGKQGKTLWLELNSREARVQDLLRLFVKADPPPLNGPVVFRAHVVLPPGKEPFLKRVRLEGDFGITDAQFTKPSTQGKVEELSERARGKKNDEEKEDPERTVSDLKGHVFLREGTATFANASFSVPGALARMQGTYNLITERIDLYGTLAMHARVSQATGGIKSILLKPLDPFFRKGHTGALIPVQITGTYSHPSFHVSLTKKGKRPRA